MSINEKQYLREMGISTWELVHPERLEAINRHYWICKVHVNSYWYRQYVQKTRRH